MSLEICLSFTTDSSRKKNFHVVWRCCSNVSELAKQAQALSLIPSTAKREGRKEGRERGREENFHATVVLAKSKVHDRTIQQLPFSKPWSKSQLILRTKISLCKRSPKRKTSTRFPLRYYKEGSATQNMQPFLRKRPKPE
jgi:hypothetical protein